MARSRKSKTSDDVRQPRRNAERLPRTSRPRPAGRSEEALNADSRGIAAGGGTEIQAIFDNTSDEIFLHDLETRKPTLCNQSCLQMLGYTLEELLTLSVADIHPEADLAFI